VNFALNHPRSEMGQKPLPAWPDTWYVVARSSDISCGEVIDGRIATYPFVIFRTQSGELVALDAHCPHMGAHLRRGKVVGDKLRCALHHFEIDRDGALRDQNGCANRQGRVWRVSERFGLVFLFAGLGPPPSLPFAKTDDEYAWSTGRPVVFRTDWRALMSNGFDFLHMRTIHQRALVSPPEFLNLGDGVIHFNYTTCVLPGGGLSSWVMKRIAKNRIRVHQTCYGTIMLVESNLGKFNSRAVFGVMPEGDKVSVFTAFGTLRRGMFWRLRLALTHWFYFAFLRKDYAVVEDMRLVVEGVDDPGVRALSEFFRSLPALR